MKFAAVLSVCLCCGSSVYGQDVGSSALEGALSGYIHILGMDVPLTLRFSEGAGTVEFHGQGTLEMAEVQHEGDHLRITLSIPPGVAVFDGSFVDGVYAGEFSQYPQSGPFHMSVGEIGDVPGPDFGPAFRTSDAFEQEEVTFSHDEYTLAGSLTLPHGEGPFPVVILISGSGSTSRDGEMLGFPVYWTVAEALTQQGIAVLRYDDPGTGGSTRPPADVDSEHFAGDVMAGIALLAAREDIDSEMIGLMGHSEGGIIAAIAAQNSEHPVGFVILMAGPPVPGYDVRLAQIRAEVPLMGGTPEQVEEGIRMQILLMDAVLAGTVDEAIELLTREAISSGAVTEADADLMRAAIAEQVAGISSPWYVYFMSYDPGPALASLTCPVLAVFGEKDVQIPSELMPAMEAVLAGNPDAQISVVDGANHLFQLADTGAVEEYAELAAEFAPGFLELVGGWILERAQ